MSIRICLSLACLVLCGVHRCATAGKPNVIVFLTDDQGWGDLACYGHPVLKTPHIDRFAAEGMRFTQCYAGSAFCSPSRSAILTGRTPYRNGVFTWIPERDKVHLRTSEITIASLLKQQGYSTCHVGKWHLNGFFNSPEQPQPSDHGYDHWFATQNNAAPDHRNPVNFVRNGKAAGPLEGFSSLLVVEEAIDWLADGRDSDKPFFLTVWTHQPHLPIESDPRFMALYEGDDDLKQHHGNISQLDHAFGMLMQALREQKLDDDTFVIFTSDNGPEGRLDENGIPRGRNKRTRGSTGGLRGRKRDMYEGGIRVPGIVRWPGQVRPGSESSEPIIGSDIFTTICDITDTPLPDRKIDGASILPALKGGAIERKVPLYWRCYIAQGPKTAMRIGDWKILADEALTQFELYDIAADPRETRELSESEPRKLMEMQTALRALNAEIEAEGPDWWQDYRRPGQRAPRKRNQTEAAIRVVVWDEQQPAQKKAYDDFLGNVVAGYLGRQPGVKVRSVSISDPEKGLSDAVLDDCDVLIWWGHVRNGDITVKEAQRVVRRIQQGRLSLIALHSAHWATPFVMAMHARTRSDVLQVLPPADRETAEIKFLGRIERRPPTRDAKLTPQARIRKRPDGTTLVELTRPNCCFPAYRNDGKPSTVVTLRKDHPIAQGIPEQFVLPHTEMYDEPFHVPEPDAVIFEERFAGGERFRSGAVWQVGKGRVFYFRPGHETHSVYAEPYALQIVENAVRWLGRPPQTPRRAAALFAKENLVAWCIVPFDASRRGPAARAAMLQELGIGRVAYDWRAEHVPTFEQEILEYRKHGLEYFAFWGAHESAFELFRKYDLHPQIWQTNPSPRTGTQAEKVAAAVAQLLPLVERTRELGCRLGLYNHGGWGGQPENLVAVCRELRRKHDAGHVGIVYNFHHAHDRIDDFASALAIVKPWLLCLNINGMNDDAKPKIVSVGRGRHEARMLRQVLESGYDGPIGILDHRNDRDAAESLRENMQGLQQIAADVDRPR